MRQNTPLQPAAPVSAAVQRPQAPRGIDTGMKRQREGAQHTYVECSSWRRQKYRRYTRQRRLPDARRVQVKIVARHMPRQRMLFYGR